MYSFSNNYFKYKRSTVSQIIILSILLIVLSNPNLIMEGNLGGTQQAVLYAIVWNNYMYNMHVSGTDLNLRKFTQKF